MIPLIRPLLALPLAAFTAATAAPDPAASPRPNVLFIAIDDLRTALGAYGDPHAITPNIDRLAASSRVFLGAYAQQAVCGPSRASLLTGKLPDNIQVWHNRNLFRNVRPDIVTMPELFKQHGYKSIAFGKLFSGQVSEEDPQSWTVPATVRQPGWNNYVEARNERGKGAAWEAADVPDNGYTDGKIADLALEALTGFSQSGESFFLGVGFLKPHLPFNAPKRYWDLHDPAKFEINDPRIEVTGAPQLAYWPHRELGGYRNIPADERVDPETARTLRHGYYACVSYVDAQVGKLLAKLTELGLADNTIIVLWGDHGFALGEINRWAKGTNFEVDNRVPLMIHAPGLTAPGTATPALVELVDIYPTIAALAGLPAPSSLDGTSLVPQLKDPSAPGRHAVLSQYRRPINPRTPDFMGYSVRTLSYRYTRWIDWRTRATVAEELYDYGNSNSVERMNSFLIEHANVVTAPALQPTLQELRVTLDHMLSTRSELHGAPRR